MLFTSLSFQIFYEFAELLPLLKKEGAGGWLFFIKIDHPQTSSFFRRGLFSYLLTFIGIRFFLQSRNGHKKIHCARNRAKSGHNSNPERSGIKMLIEPIPDAA